MCTKTVLVKHKREDINDRYFLKALGCPDFRLLFFSSF